MNKQEIISLDKEYLMQTYGRLEIAPVEGRSATLVDADGREFIDFTSGFVCPKGVLPDTDNQESGPAAPAADIIM